MENTENKEMNTKKKIEDFINFNILYFNLYIINLSF